MKLLDLQTGKYLEIGENWGYFGNKILIISNEDEELSVQGWLDAIEYDEIEKHDYDMLDIKHHTNPIINEIAEKVGAVIYGGRYVLLYTTNEKIIIANSEYDYENWNDENDKLGFDGGEPRIWKTFTIGDVYKKDEKDIGICIKSFCSTYYSYHNDVIHIEEFDDKCEAGIAMTVNSNTEYLGNIFEEFAKKEQGLENKFDELQGEIII
jgi:hypothetical protein